MIYIPAGKIQLPDSSEYIHIKKSFYISDIELTAQIIDSICHDSDVSGDRRIPKNIHSQELQHLLFALYTITGKNYRIPTKDEWTYAAMGGKRTYFSGSYSADEVGWSGMSTDSIMQSALKKPNSRGIYDMSGNVAEWVLDGQELFAMGVDTSNLKTCVVCVDDTYTGVDC